MLDGIAKHEVAEREVAERDFFFFFFLRNGLFRLNLFLFNDLI